MLITPMDPEVLAPLVEKVNRLRKERNAIILAHVYQRPEIQEVADFVGDSLQLSQLAAKTAAQVIAFCGVHFMAESAAILSPEKTVLLPELGAGCPMADMADVEGLLKKKAQIPDAIVVSYVNTSAAVKAETDICCTSSNAIKVIESLPQDRPILFVPDRNLGNYVSKITGRKMHYWEGYCNTHDRVTVEDVNKAKESHPGVPFICHPECRPEVVALADYVGSTTALVNFAVESQGSEFIIGTEEGITHRLRKLAPQKKYYLASNKLVCPNMKLTTIEKLIMSLENMQPRITVSQDIRERALKSLERMLAIAP